MNLAVVALLCHLLVTWASLQFTASGQWIGGFIGILCMGVGLWRLLTLTTPTPTHQTSRWVALIGYLIAGITPLLWLGEVPAWRLGLSVVVLLLSAGVLLAQRQLWSRHPVLMRRQTFLQETRLNIYGALLIGLSIPMLGLANRHQFIKDMTFTKSQSASATTRTLMKQLIQKDEQRNQVVVRLFFSPEAQILSTVESYAQSLKQPGVRVERLDQTTQPTLASQLQVRGNGVITITTEGPSYDGRARRWTRAIELGEQRSQARLKLRRLDALVQASLRDLTQGARTIYLVTGHGEYSWKTTEQARRLSLLYRIGQTLLTSNMAILDQQQLMSTGVPKDASAVLILGPRRPYSPEEVRALKHYMTNKGALMLALEPRFEPGEDQVRASLEPLLKHLGVVFGDRPLASVEDNVPLSQSRADRYTQLIRGLKNHPTTRGIKQADRMALLLSGMSTLEALPEHKTQMSPIALTNKKTWIDVDLDQQQGSQNAERLDQYPVIWASASAAHRAVVTSDADMWADPLMSRSPGNQQFFQDTIHWLYQREAFIGASSSLVDVRIVHSRQTQQGWFYATVLLMPLLVLGFGWWRLKDTRSS